ncbi:MAG: heavy metal-binding domain-containing protein, partial [Actinomycetota bacterium]|nr:heavy metal-binding domain-containing protein [Actinomycetota bacterium]
MGFFGRGEDPNPEQVESRQRIEEGGIPRRAQERLKGLAADGSLFTSGLSVNEFALLSRLGPAPLAQVMGASVVRTGWQYLPALEPGMIVSNPWYGPTITGRALQNPYTEASPSQVRAYRWHAEVVCGLEVLTDAWNMARRRALDRLSEEASQVGADAVVGVHLRRSDHDLGNGTIEYVVSGTAIRLPDSDGTPWPTLTDVSVQDYWRLHSAGHEPAGLVATTAVVFAAPARSTRLRRVQSTAQNQELEELSRGFQAARETVRARLLGQVSDAHGLGAVGVEFSHSGAPGEAGACVFIAVHESSGLAHGPVGAALPGLRSQRCRAEGLGGHDACGRHSGSAPAGADSAFGHYFDADGVEMTDYDPQSLEGIPESGRERLEQNRQGLYTSDLSVNEFLLVTQAGF